MTCVECGREVERTSRTGRPRRYCSRSCQGRAYRRRRDDGRMNAAASYPPSPGSRTGSALTAAIALADAEGITAVTLRVVAVRCDVPLATIQRDFGSRDRLVAAMVQHVLAPGSPERHRTSSMPHARTAAEVLTRFAEREWSAYVAHPWLVSVMASTRPPLVPAVLEASRAAVDAFASLGLDQRAALDRYLALSAFIQGMGLLLTAEHSESTRSGTSYGAWWSQEIRRLDATGTTLRHPWISELANAPSSATFSATSTFHEGLGRIIRGLVAT